MTALTAPEVYNLALATGISANHAVVMTVISFYESGWDPNNIGDQTLSKYGSRGLWQIYTGVHTPQEVLGHGGPTWDDALIAELMAPATNAHAMRVVFDSQGYQAWTTYNNLYTSAEWQSKLQEVRTAVAVPAPAPAPTPAPAPVPTPAPAVNPADAKDYLDKLGNAQPGVEKAIASAVGSHSYPVGLCLQWVRTRWGIDVGAPNAIAAWRVVPTDKRHSFYTPPAGVPVFWSGGSHGLGHVAISLGNGKVRSTDIGGAGTVTTVDLSVITAKWKMTYLGWTDALNGVVVYKEPGV